MNSKTIIEALVKDQSMESIVDNNYIKYIVSQQMFCKYSEAVLDIRTAIVVEIYKDDKMAQAFAISPSLSDKLPAFKQTLAESGLTVKFLTNNKDIQLP